MLKKILLITDLMNGYAISIKSSFEKKGFQIDIFENSVKINRKDHSFFELMIRILSNDFKIKWFKKKYEAIEIKKYKGYIKELNSTYDIILDLRAQSSYFCIKELKEKYFNSLFILFLWDDLKYQNNSLKIVPFFDRVYSYNEEDCRDYGLIFRPSFYCNEFIYSNESKEFGIFYAGNIREKDRIDIILELEKLNIENNNLFLIGRKKCKYGKKMHRFNEIKKNIIENHFTEKELADFSKKSKILLDLNYKEQNGLGLRAIESIGAKSKLITTNEKIRNYDFYNENNIFVLKKDLSNLWDLDLFLKIPYLEYSKEINYKYSINGFVDEIMTY